MKSLLVILVFSLLSSSTVFAFDSVSEILSSGKLLICKKSDQVRKGEIVENHKRANTRSTSDFSTLKASEFKLPSIGQKIKLTHRDFHSKGKGSTYHAEELGTAIISGDSLEGEERLVASLDNSRHSRRVEKKVLITKEDAITLQRDCIVAIPENGLKLTERASVSW